MLRGGVDGVAVELPLPDEPDWAGRREPIPIVVDTCRGVGRPVLVALASLVALVVEAGWLGCSLPPALDPPLA